MFESGHLKLHNVSTIEAKWILQQFFGQYKQQSGISGASRSYLQRTLDMALGPKFARSMLDGLYGDEVQSDVQLLQWVPPEVLDGPLLRQRTPADAGRIAGLPAVRGLLGRAGPLYPRADVTNCCSGGESQGDQ